MQSVEDAVLGFLTNPSYFVTPHGFTPSAHGLPQQDAEVDSWLAEEGSFAGNPEVYELSRNVGSL